MSSLENELAKYKKKGFRVHQRRTLKHGKRFFLIQKRGLFSSDVGIYIYYVDGDSNTTNIRNFLKDYPKFFEEHDFDDSQDKGFFICTGKFDKGLFRDLKEALVEDRDVRKTIKTKVFPRVSVRKEKRVVEEERIRERVTEREIRRRKITEERISVKALLSHIKKFEPPSIPRKEKQLENMLVSYLQAFYDVRTQLTYERARIDAKIGTIGIEIKYRPSAGDFDRLYGQVEKYLSHLDNVIVVIGSERSKQLTNSFKRRLKQRGWLNKRAFVTTL